MWAMRRLLELLALCGLAIVEPVLRVFGQSPTTFLANDVTGLRVVWFTALIVLVPPLVLFGLEQLVRRAAGATAATLLHRVLLTGLAAVATVGLLVRFTDVGGAAMLAVAAAAGVAFLQIIERLPAAREWVRWLAIGPFVFAGLFLFGSPVGDLLDQAPVDAIALQRIDPTGAEVAGATEIRVVTAPGTPESVAGDGTRDGTAGPQTIRDVGGAPLPDVVVVLFDELPLVSLLDGEGSIDAGLYPNLARLARTSTWYRNSTAVSDRTRSAVPATLTGRMPPATEVAATAQNYPENLFTLLGDAYRLDVWERLQLCPAQLCPRPSSGSLTDLIGDAGDVLGEQLDGEPDAPPPLAALGHRDESMHQVDRLDRFVQALAPDGDGRPTLHFMHALLPHSPWQLMPSGAAYADPDPTYGAVFDPWITWEGAEVADLARRRHGLQLQYADRQLGAILDRLEQQDRFDSTVVAVLADHGIGFTPGEEIRDFDRGSAPEVAWVPMLVKGVDQTEPVRSDASVTTMDLVPTLADRIGVRVPWRTDGRALAPDEASDAPRGFMDQSPGPDASPQAVALPESRFDDVLTWDAIGEGDDPALALYRTRAHPDLVGRTVDDLTFGSDATASIRLRTDATPIWDGTDRIPTWVDGDISPAAHGDPIAVIVNGRVGAVATVATAAGRPAAVSAIVPEHDVDEGRNKITFALVTGPPDDPTLHSIRVE